MLDANRARVSLVARQTGLSPTRIGIPGQDISLNATIIVDRFATLSFRGFNYLPGLGEPTGPVGQIFGTLFLSTPPVRFPETHHSSFSSLLQPYYQQTQQI